MLIESAFFKLSDYFQSVESPSELYEEQVSFIFAVAIYQELQNLSTTNCTASRYSLRNSNI